MGKYERDWSQIAEQAVAAALNGQPSSPSIDMIAQAIRTKFNNEDFQAIWSGGNNYARPGDLELVFPHGRVQHVELKFSRKGGSGTAKNLSQACFNEKISNTIKGYQTYDEELGLKKFRYQLVENKIGRRLQSTDDYHETLYRLRDANDPVINQVAAITQPGQISYAQYAAQELNNHLPAANRLIDEILGLSDSSYVLCVIKNFESANQTVNFPNFTLNDCNVVRVVARGKSIKFLNSKSQDVVRFSVTWKNICQGGKTPCFNVFVGNAFKL